MRTIRNDTFGDLTEGELADARKSAHPCRACGMLADVDPVLHESRYGHAPSFTTGDGTVLTWHDGSFRHLPDLAGSELPSSGESATPDVIEGAVGPEDIVRANVRAAGFPVGSAADARVIRAEAEQWARDFVAASRAEDGMTPEP